MILQKYKIRDIVLFTKTYQLSMTIWKCMD